MLYSTNKKKFKGNSDYKTYPYISGHCRIACGSVWKNRKRRVQYKPWKIGPDKYQVRITGKGYEFEITAINIKICKCTPDPTSMFPIDELLFDGTHLSKDEYFNLALQIPMLTPDEIQSIRNFMQRKDRRYVALFLYMDKDWI